MWTFETIALVFIVFLFAGTVKGVIGLGFPVVVLASLSTTLGLQETMGLLVIPGIITNGWQALSGGSFLPLTRRLGTLLLSALVGIWFGTKILSLANPALLTGVLGALLFAYSVISLTLPQISPPGRKEWLLSPLMGAAGGLSFGMTGVFMVPGVLYIQALGLPRDLFVQALGIAFSFIMIALGLFMSHNRILPQEILLLSVGALVPMSLGMLLGRQIRHRVTEQFFRKLLFVALSIAGFYLVLRAGVEWSGLVPRADLIRQ